jgi:hypothetical protein
MPRRRGLTYEQVRGRKDKAARFLRDVLEDSDRADEVEAESVEDYAARRHLVIANPHGGEVNTMPREKLKDVIDDRDTLLDKFEDVRDEIDDILGEYDEDDGGVEEEEDSDGNGED